MPSSLYHICWQEGAKDLRNENVSEPSEMHYQHLDIIGSKQRLKNDQMYLNINDVI